MTTRWKGARRDLESLHHAGQATRPHRLVCAGKLMQQIDVLQAEAVWCTARLMWTKRSGILGGTLGGAVLSV
jgi:hypothetical protein